MFRYSLPILILLAGLVPHALAQEASDEFGVSETAEKKHPPRKIGATDRHWQVRPGLAFWQENIPLKNGADTANMQTQSEGLLLDVAYSITPFRSRWRQIYGLEFGNGRIKGKGNTVAIPDELRGQSWLILGASVSYMYRSSSFSEIGVIAPFHFRTISWALKADSDLNPDRDSSFSVGAGFAYLVRFDKKQSVHLSMARHFFWDATLWSASYQIEFF